MQNVKTDLGELKRVSDLRTHSPVRTSKNRGSDKGKQMEQARFVYFKRCQICSSSFEAISTAKYCSESCKQRAKRLRKLNNTGSI